MPQIDAVLFDFGQVLSLPPDPRVWLQMQDAAGLSEELLQSGYWSHRDAYDAGQLTGDEYWRRIAGDTLTPDTLRSLKDLDVALWTRLNEPMILWVADLQRAGIRTGILSNMPDAMTEGICAKFGWIGKFDHAVWSHALKMKKPDPAIYHAAAAGLRLPPERILFLDDKEENIAAAHAVGMHGIVYAEHDQFLLHMRQLGLGSLLEPVRNSQV